MVFVDVFAMMLRVTIKSARQTRVRPHMMAMRQSSRVSPHWPLVRLGRFSPVSNTSRAASQYGYGTWGSPRSARVESWAMRLPKRKRVVPRMAWNAVGSSGHSLDAMDDESDGFTGSYALG